MNIIGGSKKAPGTSVHNFFFQFLSFSCNFGGNFGQIIGWRVTFVVGGHLRMVNPGSATECEH